MGVDGPRDESDNVVSQQPGFKQLRTDEFTHDGETLFNKINITAEMWEEAEVKPKRKREDEKGDFSERRGIFIQPAQTIS